MTLLLSRTEAWTQLTGRGSAAAGACAAVVSMLSKSSDLCPQLAMIQRTGGIEEYLQLLYSRNKSNAECPMRLHFTLRI